MTDTHGLATDDERLARVGVAHTVPLGVVLLRPGLT